MKLCPVASVRVCAWPVEALEPLRRPALGDGLDEGAADPMVLDALHAAVPQAPRDVRRRLLAAGRHLYRGPQPLPATDLATALEWVPGLASEQARRVARSASLEGYRAAHARAMEEAAAYLSGLPEGFRKALRVANPRVRPRESTRRTTATLYHYLARAAGRPTPNHLWAGAAPVDFGPTRVVRDVPAGIRAVPHLSPFQHLLAWRGVQAGYPLRANPTLRREDGCWLYYARQDACWVRHRLPASREVDGALAAPDAADAGLRADLARAGLLWPMLELPCAFRDAWEALERAGAGLRPEDRRLWTATRDRLRGLCERLESDWHRLGEGEAAAALEEASAVVADLARAWDAPPPQGDPLWIEYLPPFRVTLSDGDAAAIERALEAALGFHAALGAADRAAASIPRRLAAACPDGDLSRALALNAMDWGVDGSAADHLAPPTWEHLGISADDLARAARSLQPAADHTRLGSALVRLGAEGPWIGPITPEPWLFQARPPSDALQAWLRQSLADAEARRGFRYAEILSPVLDQPNLAARPFLVGLAVSPFASAVDPDARTLDGARLEVDGVAWLRLDGVDAPVVPIFTSPALVGRGDRHARLLQLIGFQHGRALLARPFPWLATGPHAQRLALEPGAVLCGERWTVPEAVLRATGAERYLAWRRFAREAALPTWVYAWHGGDATPELMATDSPLAVDLLRGPARLEEAPEPWLRDGQGRRFHCEIGVSFERPS